MSTQCPHPQTPAARRKHESQYQLGKGTTFLIRNDSTGCMPASKVSARFRPEPYGMPTCAAMLQARVRLLGGKRSLTEPEPRPCS